MLVLLAEEGGGQRSAGAGLPMQIRGIATMDPQGECGTGNLIPWSAPRTGSRVAAAGPVPNGTIRGKATMIRGTANRAW